MSCGFLLFTGEAACPTGRRLLTTRCSLPLCSSTSSQSRRLPSSLALFHVNSLVLSSIAKTYRRIVGARVLHSSAQPTSWQTRPLIRPGLFLQLFLLFFTLSIVSETLCRSSFHQGRSKVCPKSFQILHVCAGTRHPHQKQIQVYLQCRSPLSVFSTFSLLFKKEDLISEEQEKNIRQVDIGYEQLVVLSTTILLTAFPLAFSHFRRQIFCSCSSRQFHSTF